MKRKFLIIAISLTLFGTGFTFTGWRSRVAKGNQAMQSGNTESAVAAYQEALIDAPDEPVIHYNLASALYRQGDFTGAKEHFTKTLESENTGLTQQAEYNLGNTAYREGTGLSQTNPQEAINHYEEALQHYQNVMKADPSDQDAKFNYEFVKKKLEELKDQLDNQEQEGQSDDGSEDREHQEDQNGDRKQDEQNHQEDQQGQQNEQPQPDRQKENQQEQNSAETRQQSSEEQESGTGEEESAGDRQAGTEEGEDGEELQGLTQAQALQLLEQFEDQVGEWIPVSMESDDNRRPGKDW